MQWVICSGSVWMTSLLSKLTFESGQDWALDVTVEDTEQFSITDNAGVVRGRKGIACWRVLLLAPKRTASLTLWPCARDHLAPRLRVCSPRVLHQSCILFASHWLIGSSPPAAVETPVWVLAKWGCRCVHGGGGAGQDAPRSLSWQCAPR